MADTLIENPILNSPFREPDRHFRFGDEGITNEIVETRRASAYFVPIPPPKKKGKQLQFETQWTQDRIQPNDQVNRIRERVKHWREGEYQGATQVTRKLLQYWTNPDRENKVFFCQVEALETLIYLTESARKVGDNSIDNWLRDANESSNPGLNRVAMKMATGSGKTVVMAMLIAWHAVNKIAEPKDRRFTNINDEVKFEPEYADVYGVPFSFLPCSGTTKQPKPGPTPTRVHALADRIARAITWPRLLGYRYELPGERLTARFNGDAKFTITNADLATKTEVEGIVGELRVDTLDDLKQRRPNEVAFRLAKLTLEKYFRDDAGHDKPWLFPQLLAITNRWLGECLTCNCGTFPQLLFFVRFGHEAADRIYRSIVSSADRAPTLKPILRPHETVGTTKYVDFHTIRETYKTRADKCHVSHVAGDSGWEFKLAQELEYMPEVVSYVKNQSLGFTIPYTVNGVERQYYPDFLVRLDDGRGKNDLLNLIVEVTGERDKDKEAKTATSRTRRVPAVNNHGGFGRWVFVEITDPYDDVVKLIRAEANRRATAEVV
ncbi:MAG: hypothetical protein ACLQVF_08065 [Isosphaeraceae bacterium]